MKRIIVLAFICLLVAGCTKPEQEQKVYDKYKDLEYLDSCYERFDNNSIELCKCLGGINVLRDESGYYICGDITPKTKGVFN